jgi:uncharacterized protein YceH (UPF0502 family)
MDILSPEEVRVIGALIEKKYTTPDYYPMTLNSLTNACNQKSSRDPVVNYDEFIVEEIIGKLREKGLIKRITGGDHRVTKHAEAFCEFYELSLPQIAVLCLLFLRGPQTVGEIRSRSKRIYAFHDLSETEDTILQLIKYRDNPLILRLPKNLGRDYRYAHLFSGEPVIQILEESKPKLSLEKKIDALEEEIHKLRKEFEQFKKEFE